MALATQVRTETATVSPVFSETTRCEPFGEFWRHLSAVFPARADVAAFPSMRVAASYAAAIVRYWEILWLGGAMDKDEPLIVMDLTPRGGYFAWQMMLALRDGRAVLPFAIPPLRYVACAEDRAEQDALEAHPYLSALIDEGNLSVVLRESLFAETAPIASQNPVVVLASGLGSALANELYAVHYGAVLEGRVRRSEPTALSYEWPAADMTALAPATQALLETYRKSMNSAPVLLPTGLIDCLDAIERISGERYLLLSSDSGIADEREIRLGMFAPPTRISDVLPPLPFNHHALAVHLRSMGAEISQFSSAGGVTLNLVLRDDVYSSGTTLLPAIRHALSEIYDDPLDFVRARRGRDDCLPLDECLRILRLSRHDPSVIELIFPSLCEGSADVSGTALNHWCEALERTWMNYFPLPDNGAFCGQMGWLALQMNHYGLAREAYRTGLSLYGENAFDRCRLAWCIAQIGDLKQAIMCLQDGLRIAPDDSESLQLFAELQARRRVQEKATWFREELAYSDDLCLEPLAIHHAENFYYQYRDPQIGTMTSLPEFGGVEEARAWIAAQSQESGRMTCAVLHADWGFVGTASVRCVGDAAYFHFWIGLDYQGFGFGPRAGTLLLNMMRANGIRRIYTSAFADNHRSLIALAKIGFRRLSAIAAPPDEDLIFFACDDAVSEQSSCDALAALCQAIGSPFCFSDNRNPIS